MERSSRPRLPAIGDLVLGKYRVIRQVGEGGMGVVFEALHERLDQRVALKLLRPEASSSPEVVARFAREARAAGKLGSRHTARIIDIEDHQGLPLMVMEFLDGCDLSTELERGGPLPIETAVGYVLATCVAMAEAHALGIVHRDLKPSNLFLSEEGGERVVKVLDFGISKMTEAQDVHLTSTSGALGTPLYMSPEQVRSAKKVDPRTDIWSLGVILYELLTDKLPFYGENGTAVVAAIVADDPPPIREIRPEIPEGLAAAINRALSKQADGRPADVRAFAALILPFGPPAASGRFAISVAGANAPSLTPRKSDAAVEMAATQLERVSAPGTPASTQGSWSTKNDAKARPRALILLSAAGVVAVVGVIGAAVATRGGHTVPAASLTPSATPPPTVAATVAEVPTVTATATASAPATPPASAPAVTVEVKPPPPLKPLISAKAPIPPPPTATATTNPNRL